ncbi:hypothetical protein ACFWOT_15080 [Streptomyces sp. NPDC058440]|uniref:hypothetical protein n=1 Tax=Streptomyces sp. NPDC058440 TaxID=3346501 RepID=UPI0036507BBE
MVSRDFIARVLIGRCPPVGHDGLDDAGKERLELLGGQASVVAHVCGDHAVLLHQGLDGVLFGVLVGVQDRPQCPVEGVGGLVGEERFSRVVEVEELHQGVEEFDGGNLPAVDDLPGPHLGYAALPVHGGDQLRLSPPGPGQVGVGENSHPCADPFANLLTGWCSPGEERADGALRQSRLLCQPEWLEEFRTVQPLIFDERV